MDSVSFPSYLIQYFYKFSPSKDKNLFSISDCCYILPISPFSLRNLSKIHGFFSNFYAAIGSFIQTSKRKKFSTYCQYYLSVKILAKNNHSFFSFLPTLSKSAFPIFLCQFTMKILLKQIHFHHRCNETKTLLPIT